MIRLSSTRLLSSCASTRSHMSQTERERAVAVVARRDDRVHGALADALDRGQAEADLAVDTTKSEPEVLTSGGSTSMPMFVLSAT